LARLSKPDSQPNQQHNTIGGAMPTLLEVWQSRLGIAEVAGPQHNAVILQWWRDAGHPEIIEDELAWCSAAMCSAAKEAGLPFPPVNVNPMARSWLTMGVRVVPGDVQPGDVVVWPRGAPPAGHVNCVQDVRVRDGKTEVRCIGGNQSHRSGGAVTLTGWQSIDGALPNGIRRLVRATVKDLRAAGSTTIKEADTQQKLGIVGSLIVPVLEGLRAVVEGMFGSVAPPKFESLPDGLTWWGTLFETAGRVWTYAADHPWLAAILIVSIGLVVHAQLTKRGRVVEHAAGIPIAAEVARLQEA
jgi:uncharacterized protein (TIGR02594 family)